MAITVRFTGICTHLNPLPGAKKTHRVALVRADNGAFVNDEAIPPHIPKLRIDPKDITCIEGYPYGLEPMGPAGVWQIRGVSFALDGVEGDGVERDESFSCVPRLRCDSTLPGPSDDVMHLEQVACYFDFTAGTLTAEINPVTSAYESVMTVQTGTTPTLVGICFWNRQVTRIGLKEGANIIVDHSGFQHGDSDKDFLLHYRIFQRVPKDAHVPPESKAGLKRMPGDISVGCSNSQYP